MTLFCTAHRTQPAGLGSTAVSTATWGCVCYQQQEDVFRGEGEEEEEEDKALRGAAVRRLPMCLLRMCSPDRHRHATLCMLPSLHRLRPAPSAVGLVVGLVVASVVASARVEASRRLALLAPHCRRSTLVLMRTSRASPAWWYGGILDSATLACVGLCAQ